MLPKEDPEKYRYLFRFWYFNDFGIHLFRYYDGFDTRLFRQDIGFGIALLAMKIIPV